MGGGGGGGGDDDGGDAVDDYDGDVDGDDGDDDGDDDGGGNRRDILYYKRDIFVGREVRRMLSQRSNACPVI